MALFYKHQRFIAAGAALGLALTAMIAAAQAGEVRLGAGDVQLVLGHKDGAAVALHIGERSCPPECDLIAIGWDRTTTTVDATIFRNL